MGAIVKVDSSYVHGIGYDPTQRLLTVQHKTGDTYHYHNVGPAVHEALMESESKGKFLSQRIKGYYRESR